MARLGSWIKAQPEGIYVEPADEWIDPSNYVIFAGLHLSKPHENVMDIEMIFVRGLAI